MREKYSCYEFEVKQVIREIVDGAADIAYIYEIYSNDADYIHYLGHVLRESDEYYDTEQQARFAAVGHIDLLENGEG